MFSLFTALPAPSLSIPKPAPLPAGLPAGPSETAFLVRGSVTGAGESLWREHLPHPSHSPGKEWVHSPPGVKRGPTGRAGAKGCDTSLPGRFLKPRAGAHDPEGVGIAHNKTSWIPFTARLQAPGLGLGLHNAQCPLLRCGELVLGATGVQGDGGGKGEGARGRQDRLFPASRAPPRSLAPRRTWSHLSAGSQVARTRLCPSEAGETVPRAAGFVGGGRF